MKHRVHRTTTASVTHPIDVEIGRRIAQRRTQLGMSIAALAALLHISARRMHSFETGQVSISASDLVAIAAALGLAVFHFFEARNPQPARPQGDGISGPRKNAPRRTEETEDLLRAYNSIRDPESRRMLARVVQKLAAGYGEEKEAPPATRKRRAMPSPQGGGWLN